MLRKMLIHKLQEISRINIQIGKDIGSNDNERKDRQNQIISHGNARNIYLSTTIMTKINLKRAPLKLI